jgi:hypothetical protein
MATLTVKDFDGKPVNVESYKTSLLNFPSFAQKLISDDGIPFLSNVTLKKSKCGCDITGNGTLQFPLSVQHCKKHR